MNPIRRTHGACATGLVHGLLAAGLLVAASPSARAEVVTEYVVTTNSASTNVFVGLVGIGTNAPGAPLHVAGDARVGGGLTVSGAMTIPRQGDVGMGSYTGGVSAAGAQGALPAGSEGNLLWHSGSAWTALTNMVYDPSSGRLYFGSATNGATYLDTATGRLVMRANIVLGDHYISRSGGDSGIAIESDGDIALSGGDMTVGGQLTARGNVGLGGNYISRDGTNAGMSVDTNNNVSFSGDVSVGGLLEAGGNVALGSGHISRSGSSTGISIDSGGNMTLAGGDVSLAGKFTVDSSTGAISVNSNALQNLPMPSANADAATKGYVDEQVGGVEVPPYGCAFFVYQSTAQSVGSGSTVTVRMDTERFDLGNDFTTWSGSDCYFTAPEDGYYVFGGACCLQGMSNGGLFNVKFRKNSGSYAYAAQTYPGNGPGYPTESGSVVVYLSQGNTMRLRVYNGDGSSHNTLNWSTTTYFWGYRLK